ncbi:MULTISPECIES: DUF3775 domain-containing protein [Legionella]|uniref:DUF3775 domain-containing protein n=1 Tax=Legionella maceachernii TaxID=466 RepID=A0A0W0WE73_9GAMM|nr:DUF3775 domain-containing protein [Legionella maceachernii]KTD30558.1 hypothetical protein Lmac_0553 [Legionella maceachernii]SJZ77999.1 Protein of unknown function [Legionella maceachernii]SUP03004.1 Protein of uncharacterised function (DUF3775) [Legionella maceachernii]
MVNKNNLTINPEIVCFIISRAREFHAKEEVTFSEKMPDSSYEYDWAQVLADHVDDLCYIEVKKEIEAFDQEQKVALLALMYVGRGDFEGYEWDAAQQEAKNNLADNLTDYLFAKPLIAYYLEKGLEALGYSCDE